MHRSEPVDPDMLKLQRAIVAHLRACWSTASADAYLDVVAAVVGAVIVDLVAHPQVAPSTQAVRVSPSPVAQIPRFKSALSPLPTPFSKARSFALVPSVQRPRYLWQRPHPYQHPAFRGAVARAARKAVWAASSSSRPRRRSAHPRSN